MIVVHLFMLFGCVLGVITCAWSQNRLATTWAMVAMIMAINIALH